LKITFASTVAGQGSGVVTIEVDNDIEYKFTYKSRPTNTTTFETQFKKMIEENIALLKNELKEKLQSSEKK